jgi:hypothetical protein
VTAGIAVCDLGAFADGRADPFAGIAVATAGFDSAPAAVARVDDVVLPAPLSP